MSLETRETAPATTPPAPPAPERGAAPPAIGAAQRRRVLLVMCAALALVVSGVASLNIALPEIARELAASQTDLQWIVDAYALVFAGLLLPAGAIGDRYGRRGVLVAGLAVLAGAYLAATLATAAGALIAARAVAGLGAAAIMPVTLSVITTVFPPEERDRAVAAWAGVAGAGAILGLLISGVLLEVASWEWLFAVNAGWALLALVATLAVVPRTRDARGAALDPLGGLLSAAGLGAVVFAIIEAPGHGWLDRATLAWLGAGAALLVAFVAWELRREHPMLDPRLFRQRGFSAGTLAILLQFFAAFGFLFVALQYLQFVLGYSPLEAAAAIVPLGVTLMISARRVAPRLARRHGPRRAIALGLALMAAGLATLAAVDVATGYWHLLGGLVLFGAGAGLSAVPATTSIVSSLPPEKQGVASAVNDASREVGGALGIAVLGSVLAGAYADGVSEATAALPPRAQEAAAQSIGFVLEAPGRFGARGAELVAEAQASFVDGLSLALLVAAGVLATGAAAVLARGPRRAA